MSIKATITDDLNKALRESQTERLSTLRMLLSSIKNQEISKRAELDDGEAVKLLQKELKSRQDSITMYQKAGRSELADKEAAEIEVIKAYLPAQMPEAEVRAAVERVAAELQPTGMSDMGAMMKRLNQELSGQADSGLLAAVVKEHLSKL